MSRRAFFKTVARMAAAFVAMNETHGAIYDVSRAEAAIPEMASQYTAKHVRQADGIVGFLSIGVDAATKVPNFDTTR
jgi:hypothetical protein